MFFCLPEHSILFYSFSEYSIIFLKLKKCLHFVGIATISQEPYIIWLSFMVHICKMIISRGVFFQFFKILIFRVKVQKMVQNYIKICASCSISQKSYIIWLSFMVHMYKMIISPGVFFHFFKILIFCVANGVKGQKMVQDEKKFCHSHLISQEPYIIWSSFIVHMCKRIISPGFFHFLKILKKFVCPTPYLRKHTSFDFDFDV